MQFRTRQGGRTATWGDLPRASRQAPSYTETMKTLRIALLALACTVPLAATAQWQWLDKDGRKVFSDKAPPPEVPANRIVKQPGGARSL